MGRVFSKGFFAGALLLAGLVALTVLLAPIGAGNASAGTASRVIVQFSPGTPKASMQTQSAVAAGDAMLVRSFTSPSAKLISYAVYSSDTLTVAELVKQFEGRAGVVAVSQDYERHAVMTPNDTSFSNLWGLENTGQVSGVVDADIDAPLAWDTAHRQRHRDRRHRLGRGLHPSRLERQHVGEPGEIAGDSIDNDGNGYVDDVYGIDASAGDSNPMDENGHGTHTAGTIAGVGNNSAGVIGVAYQAKVMALRFLDAGGSGSDSGAIACINYAINMKLNHGVNIVALSNSWGGAGYDLALYNAIQSANSAGIVFVAAAGNYGTNNDSVAFYPANYSNTNLISVGASTSYDQRASFSNYGATSVDLFAPGNSIYSTYLISKGSYYTYMNGTSMATPHVSGVVALVAQLHASDTVATRISRILLSVDKVPAFSGYCVTGGRLNAANAVATGTPTVTALTPSTGATAGGTAVVIAGTGFAALSGTSAVTFGGANATSYTVNSPTQITAVAPAHAAGAVDVRVTTSFGSSANTVADDYTYALPPVPVISSLNPDERLDSGRRLCRHYRHRPPRSHLGTLRRDVRHQLHGELRHSDHRHCAGACSRVCTGPGDDPGRPHRRHRQRRLRLRAPGAGHQLAQPDERLHHGNHLGDHQRDRPDRSHRGAVRRDPRHQLHRELRHQDHRRRAGPRRRFGAGASDDPGRHHPRQRPATTTPTTPSRSTVTGLSPTTGSTAGATSVIITGTNLTGASAVSFGGTAATSFTVNSATQITAVAPRARGGAPSTCWSRPPSAPAPTPATTTISTTSRCPSSLRSTRRAAIPPAPIRSL